MLTIQYRSRICRGALFAADLRFEDHARLPAYRSAPGFETVADSTQRLQVAGMPWIAFNFLPQTPHEYTVTLGLGQSFTATVTFSDSTTQIATPYVQWTTSNPAIAVVTRGGFAYSTGKGTANISANLDGISGYTTLTVQ